MKKSKLNIGYDINDDLSSFTIESIKGSIRKNKSKCNLLLKDAKLIQSYLRGRTESISQKRREDLVLTEKCWSDYHKRRIAKMYVDFMMKYDFLKWSRKREIIWDNECYTWDNGKWGWDKVVLHHAAIKYYSNKHFIFVAPDVEKGIRVPDGYKISIKDNCIKKEVDDFHYYIYHPVEKKYQLVVKHHKEEYHWNYYSKELADSTVKKKIKQGIQLIKDRRKDRALTLLKNKFDKFSDDKKRRMLNKFFVYVDDSLRAGNCESQTRAFRNTVIKKFGGLNIKAVKASILLNIRDDMYVWRAVDKAFRRYVESFK